MKRTVITVEDLGKHYKIRHAPANLTTPYRRLSEELLSSATMPFRVLGKLVSGSLARENRERAESEVFWALHGLSFEVEEGEVLGIIGRNGAGKSTLLKVLSRITDPSAGRVTLRGRVASLLEVGTGFHPELSGRENVFLNGAILGMSRNEISRRFDEIVQFAGVERFLDTPVKRYSSGMYVRLAFAVAAHLEPEVLLVDEVLAVGDAEFQSRCLGKMQTVAREGRTVLFVSHNMSAVERLCSRVLMLENGSCDAIGETDHVVHRYLSTSGYSNASLVSAKRSGSGEVLVEGITLHSMEGNETNHFRCGETFAVHIRGRALKPLKDIHCALGLYDHLGRETAYVGSEFGGKTYTLDGDFDIRCEVLAPNIFPGDFTYNLAFFKGREIYSVMEHCGGLAFENTDFFGVGKMPPFGPVLVKSHWT